ncbi:MAG: hypothetical protein K2N17_05775 [Clostridia bacterium]|nr:hypothetical protein [Clostridia bacterium]
MKIKRKTFVGGLLAALCACTALTFGAVYSPDNKVDASAATTVKVSILNLDGSTFKDSLTGAQEENIYFGTNGSTVKWRVLDTGDNNKYGSGMLLWADNQLGAEQYNVYCDNPDYAYWGTSKIRASLNGGTYYKAVSNTTATPSATTEISEDDSWYNQLFNDEEKNSVVKSGSYITDALGCDTSSSNKINWVYKKRGITGTSNGLNGKYNTNRLSNPTAQYAGVVGTSPNQGIQESTSEDYLFLLDYYDINTVNYGFSDGGQSYAKKVASASGKNWDTSSDWFPAYFDAMSNGQPNNGTITSNYLKFTGETATCYWLRSALRNNTYTSHGLFVNTAGHVGAYMSVQQSLGLRPAFNFNPETVVYATAADISSISSTFTSVNTAKSYADGKPAYKIYIKAEDYVQYSN